MPTVPVSVWEQVSIIVIFAFLLAGLGWLMVRVFSNAVADINRHYANVISASNEQWQKYIDAKSEVSDRVSSEMVKKLEELTLIIQRPQNDFERHDALEMSLLAQMNKKIKPKVVK